MMLRFTRCRGWALGTLVLGNCQSPDAPVSQPAAHVAPVSRPSHPRDGDAGRALADFGGTWLNEGYMARVRQTRSSLQANGHWGPSGVAELLITPGSSRGDSLRVELGYSNHEGGPTWYLHLRPASGGAVRQAAAAPTPGLPALELRLLVKGPDTVLYLHEAAHDGQRAHVTAFRRVPGRPEKANFTPPLQRFVNAHTLAGAHTATDSTGTVYTVRFSPEGAVTGMPGHRRYWVNFDFEGPFQEYDYVVFDESQPQKEVLAFTTHGDTVRLYRVIDDTTVYKRRLGKLRLSLVRSTK